MSAFANPQESPSPSVSQTDVDPTVIGSDAVVIAITEDSQFYLNKQPVERIDLPRKVSALLDHISPEQRIVYLNAMPRVRYDIVVSIIGSLREVGVEQIGLVADKRGAVSPARQRTRVSQSGRRIIRTIRADDGLVISVKASTARNQRVRVRSMSLPLVELSATLREILATRNDKAVFIKAPGRTLHRDIMRIIDVVKAAGARPVGLMLSEDHTNTKRIANTRRDAP